MRSSIITGISLTLFMLLLVLSAAFLFLFQGRQTIERQATRVSGDAAGLRQDLAQTQLELDASEATREAETEKGATAEAETVLLDAELMESDRSAEVLATRTFTLSAELASANETLSTLRQGQEQALQRPPDVQFIAPEDGMTIAPDESVELIVAAADASGIVAVSLTVDETPLDSYAADAEPLVTYRQTWTATEPGDHTISAVAANGNAVASEPVTLTVQVIDFETRNQTILNQVEANVTEIRALELGQQISITFLTEDEFNRALPAADSSQSANDRTVLGPGALRSGVLTLAAFDFVPTDFDLDEAISLLQSEFGPMVHAPSTTSATSSLSVVVNEEGSMDAMAQKTFIHELVHALQEQNYGMLSLFDGAQDSEALKAVTALAEGEAEFVAALYQEAGYFAEEQIAELEGGSSRESVLGGDFPIVLINEWTFPRTVGFIFARELYQMGEESFSLIDDAWTEPPLSTEHILHPERYLDGDAPELVTLPDIADTLGQGWELVNEDVLGEFTLRQYLQQQLNTDLTNTAATGWGGDRYVVYWNEAEAGLVMGLRIVWDTVPDGAEFAAIYPGYPTRLFGVSGEIQPTAEECWQDSETICFAHSGNEAFIVGAPNLGLAVAIIQQLESQE